MSQEHAEDESLEEYRESIREIIDEDRELFDALA